MYADSNPERIPRIIGILTEIWTRNPGMRLCQIIGNVGMMEGTEDPFFVSDKRAEIRLKELLEQCSENRP